MKKLTRTLLEKLGSEDISDEKINPHEVAQELKKLCESGDISGVIELRDAYFNGLVCRLPAVEAKSIVKENLTYAANLADLVSREGYEASGQLMALSALQDAGIFEDGEVSGKVTGVLSNY